MHYFATHMLAARPDPFAHASRGEPIAGSVLYRAFCSSCGEPIRVQARDRMRRRCECHRCQRLRPGRSVRVG